MNSRTADAGEAFAARTPDTQERSAESAEDTVSATVRPHFSVAALSVLLVVSAGSAAASQLIPQTWLPGDCIPQFATPLPIFGPGYNAALPRIDALRHPLLKVTMKETQRQVLPAFTPSGTCPAVNIQPTRVWAYETRDWLTGKVLGPAYWPAVKTGRNWYPFDPTKGPGYVWHCHIIDHEDNEMMRPYKVSK